MEVIYYMTNEERTDLIESILDDIMLLTGASATPPVNVSTQDTM